MKTDFFARSFDSGRQKRHAQCACSLGKKRSDKAMAQQFFGDAPKAAYLSE
jgi:hypothetical protein